MRYRTIACGDLNLRTFRHRSTYRGCCREREVGGPDLSARKVRVMTSIKRIGVRLDGGKSHIIQWGGTPKITSPGVPLDPDVGVLTMVVRIILGQPGEAEESPG